METTLEILRYITPLLGVVVGWLLAQLAEKSKAAREDKPKLKRTIFYLLEVRHQLSFYSIPDHQFNTYLSLIKKKFKPLEAFRNVDESQYKMIISAFLKAIVADKPLIPERQIENLHINFLKCIENLSEIDPIVAFRLHGRQNVPELIKDFIERSKIPIAEITKDVKDVEELTAALKEIEPNVITSVVQDLDLVLLKLAKKVDRRTFKQTKKISRPNINSRN
jgi:hypothetical protein